VLELARGGIAEGLWLAALRQTAGRGREGRTWVSPVGNLYISTLVRIRPSDPAAPTLALVAAVALEETVRVFAPALAGLAIKWPNDLLIDGAKLSGILLEREGDAVVIGFGVNIAERPDNLDRAVTSLADHGIAVERRVFAETLAEVFGRWLERWRGEGLGVVRDRWVERALAKDTALTARLPDGSSFDGLFQGLDQHGALILRLADGRTHVMHAGDVFLI